ncbi:sugar transferase [Halorussus pelagicus]|uniref:sugar transferase n=1 Tax=Halorussus pelagicus TaxID=2505977 RepID=UPI0034A38747
MPTLRQLPVDVLVGEELILAVATTVVVVVGSFAPLFKPQPRRILDMILLVQKRVVLAGLVLAAVGYFDYTYRLPRTTLIGTAVLLVVGLQALFIVIRHRPTESKRAIVVGDNPEEVHDALDATDVPIVGYVSPPSRYASDGSERRGVRALADGSGEADGNVEYLGGLSRFDEVLVEHDVDTAILAFERPDRADFFGTLHTCHEYGIHAMAPRKHSETVLTSPETNDSIIKVDLEPWDWQERAFKRLFDVAFAGTALLALSPVILTIATAIKIEGHGPIFFTQDRTDRFGGIFQIYKFRTLKPEPDDEVSLDIEGDRRTPLGEFLRKTHLDEIPQLWSILVGDMSVVGPRPAITELEPDYVSEVNIWKQRWFVKPGLTGLAQINEATGKEPSKKIEYDVEYIRKQSLQFDVVIVIRQIWQVVEELLDR